MVYKLLLGGLHVEANLNTLLVWRVISALDLEAKRIFECNITGLYKLVALLTSNLLDCPAPRTYLGVHKAVQK